MNCSNRSSFFELCSEHALPTPSHNSTVSRPECPLPPYHGYSFTRGLIFNVPSAKLMRWIVGKACSEQDRIKVTFENINPFKNIFFIVLFTTAVLLVLAVPLSIFVLSIPRKKQNSEANNHVQFVLLDLCFVVAALLLGFLAIMLIWNNEELAQANLVENLSLYDRVEEHIEKFICLITKYFPRKTEESPNIEGIHSTLKSALDKVVRAQIDGRTYSFLFIWRRGLNNSINSASFPNSSDAEAVKQINSFLNQTMEPISILGVPVYHKKKSSKRDDLFERFIDAVKQITRKLAIELESQQHWEDYYSDDKIHKKWSSIFSWLSVFTAITIILLSLVIRILFVIRALTFCGKPADQPVTSSQPLSRVISIRMTVLCALVLAILGVFMAFLCIWSIYDGYVTACYENAAGMQNRLDTNLSFATDANYTIQLNMFLHKCESNFSFAEAFGTPLFLDDDIMYTYGVNLTTEEGAGGITDEDLKGNIEKYYNNALALQNQSREVLKAFQQIVTKDHFSGRTVATLRREYKKLCEAPSKVIPANKTKLLEKFIEEVRRLSPPKKAPIFRERVRTAVDIMQTKRHKCRDLPLLWNQSQTLLYSSIVEPAQGQWLICVFFALLTIVSFVATIRLSMKLSAIENTSSSLSQPSKSKNLRRHRYTGLLLGYLLQEHPNYPPKTQQDQLPKSTGGQVTSQEKPEKPSAEIKSAG